MGTEPADIVKAIKAAKTEIGFGFGVGANPQGHVLLAERGKSGDQLIGLVKKSPGIKASCGGTVTWDGGGAVFACEKPVPGLDKQIEAWFKANKQTLKVSVLAGKAAIEKAQGEDEGDEDEEEKGNVLFAAETIEKRIKQSKNKEMNFAFGLSGKGNLLAMHPLRDGEKLFRMVKAENGAAKKCWGKVALDGAVVVFTCEEGPIPGLKRHLREMFKEWKFAWRVTIMGPEGELSDEQDEANEKAAPPEVETAGNEAPEVEAEEQIDERAVAALRQKLAALLPNLQSFAKTAPARAGDIRQFYQIADKALGMGDVRGATPAYERLEEIGEEAQDLVQTATALHKELDDLLAKLKPIVSSDAVRGKLIRENYAECSKALKACDIQEGNRLLDILKRFGGATDNGNASGNLLEQWKAARAEWRDASEEVDKQIAALQAVLVVSDDEDLVAIGKFGVNAITGNFKVRLMAAMMELDRADQANFAKAAPKALDLVKGFQTHLDSDVRVEAVDDNPFGISMSVRQTLGGALKAMEQVLQAA